MYFFRLTFVQNCISDKKEIKQAEFCLEEQGDDSQCIIVVFAKP